MSSLRKALYLSPTSARFTLHHCGAQKQCRCNVAIVVQRILVTTGLGTEQLEETLKHVSLNIILHVSIVIVQREKASLKVI